MPRKPAIGERPVYVTVLAALLASELLFAPERTLVGDNVWHFKAALDIAAGKMMFWSGVDGNRIFPDLLIALASVELPHGDRYMVWLDYYYVIWAVCFWLSLLLLAAVLYEDRPSRGTFVALCVGLFVVASVALRYWDRWIMVPGNNGGSIPVVIVAVSLLVKPHRRDLLDYGLLALYALLCAGLVMSNRYLIVSVMFPFAVASLLMRRPVAEKLSILTATLVAVALGLAMLHALNSSSFFRLVAPAAQPTLGQMLSIKWWLGRLPKEAHALDGAFFRAQILGGMLLMALAVYKGLRTVSGSKSTDDRLIALSTFVSTSVIAAATFILVMVDDPGDWHYRYFVVPFALSIVLLATHATRAFIDGGIRGGPMRAALGCLIAAPVALTLVESRTDFWSMRERESQFQHDIANLSQVLARHDGKPVHLGFAGYWIANDVTARVPEVKLASVLDGPVYRPYNNNAEEVCRNGYSFVIVRMGDPKIDLLTTRPSSIEQVNLSRFGPVQVLFYDPAVLDEKIVRPARDAARREFPSFRCAH